MIVDCAVYTNGERRPGRLDLAEGLEAAADPDSFVWIGLHNPTPEEFTAVRDEFDLHELAVEDAVDAHQRPKVEVYDEDLFVVLKTARYDDATEAIEFAELQLFIGASYVVSVRHGPASALAQVRARLEVDPDRVRWGPMAVLHGIIDQVVDDYGPVMEGLDNDMAEIEDTVFDLNRPWGIDPSQRIYKLKREILGFIRNTESLLEPLGRLAAGQYPGGQPELDSYFRDVEDHLTRVVSSIHHARELLTDALDANLAQVTTRQNDDMRTISAWVAMGGFPTVVGAVYGMNFDHMPELGGRYNYFIVMALTIAFCLGLYRRFKRIGWL